jgi:hypothetical protein
VALTAAVFDLGWANHDRVRVKLQHRLLTWLGGVGTDYRGTHCTPDFSTQRGAAGAFLSNSRKEGGQRLEEVAGSWCWRATMWQLGPSAVP